MLHQVEKAFKDLSQLGILSKTASQLDLLGGANCSCCAPQELYPLVEKRSLRGFAFYTPDDEELVELGDRDRLFIYYGAGSDPETVAVGQSVRDALIAQGLTIEWDVAPESVIEVRE